MKQAIVVTALALFTAIGITGCSGDDGTSLMSSAYAAPMSDPLYPPLQADADDRQVFEYY